MSNMLSLWCWQAVYEESDSWSIRGKGVSAVIWPLSLSEQAFLLQHLQQYAEFTALRETSFSCWATQVICKIFFFCWDRIDLLICVLWSRKKNTSMPHPMWQVFTNTKKAAMDPESFVFPKFILLSLFSRLHALLFLDPFPTSYAFQNPLSFVNLPFYCGPAQWWAPEQCGLLLSEKAHVAKWCGPT